MFRRSALEVDIGLSPMLLALDEMLPEDGRRQFRIDDVPVHRAAAKKHLLGLAPDDVKASLR
jgi:hypothetical protein